MDNLTEILKGVLEGCVLDIVSRGATYGYEITNQLKKLGFKDVVEGTVYTILIRLEKNGFVESQRKPSEVGPSRKFYSLTKHGLEELEYFWARWDYVSLKVNDLRRR